MIFAAPLAEPGCGPSLVPGRGDSLRDVNSILSYLGIGISLLPVSDQ